MEWESELEFEAELECKLEWELECKLEWELELESKLELELEWELCRPIWESELILFYSKDSEQILLSEFSNKEEAAIAWNKRCRV